MMDDAELYLGGRAWMGWWVLSCGVEKVRLYVCFEGEVEVEREVGI